MIQKASAAMMLSSSISGVQCVKRRALSATTSSTVWKMTKCLSLSSDQRRFSKYCTDFSGRRRESAVPSSKTKFTGTHQVFVSRGLGLGAFRAARKGSDIHCFRFDSAMGEGTAELLKNMAGSARSSFCSRMTPISSISFIPNYRGPSDIVCISHALRTMRRQSKNGRSRRRHRTDISKIMRPCRCTD